MYVALVYSSSLLIIIYKVFFIISICICLHNMGRMGTLKRWFRIRNKSFRIRITA